MPQVVAKVAETFEPVHHAQTPSKTQNTETLCEFRYALATYSASSVRSVISIRRSMTSAAVSWGKLMSTTSFAYSLPT